MTWSHAVAPIIEDAAAEQSTGAVAPRRWNSGLLAQLRLNRLEQPSFDDGPLFALQNLTLERDLADVKAIAKQVREWTACERNTADRLPSSQFAELRNDPVVAQIGH